MISSSSPLQSPKPPRPTFLSSLRPYLLHSYLVVLLALVALIPAFIFQYLMVFHGYPATLSFFTSYDSRVGRFPYTTAYTLSTLPCVMGCVFPLFAMMRARNVLPFFVTATPIVFLVILSLYQIYFWIDGTWGIPLIIASQENAIGFTSFVVIFHYYLFLLIDTINLLFICYLHADLYTYCTPIFSMQSCF
jgi:hypothetical protein